MVSSLWPQPIHITIKGPRYQQIEIPSTRDVLQDVIDGLQDLSTFQAGSHLRNLKPGAVSYPDWEPATTPREPRELNRRFAGGPPIYITVNPTLGSA